MNTYLKHFSGRSMPVGFGLDTTERRTIAVLSGTTAVGLGFYLWTGWNPILFFLPGGWEAWKRYHANLKIIAENKREIAEGQQIWAENQRKIAENQRIIAENDARLAQMAQQQFSSQQFSSDSQDYDYEMYKKLMQMAQREGVDTAALFGQQQDKKK